VTYGAGSASAAGAVTSAVARLAVAILIRQLLSSTRSVQHGAAAKPHTALLYIALVWKGGVGLDGNVPGRHVEDGDWLGCWFGLIG
jgi:hypothetical protein